jgi:hypothetical protein
MRPGEVMVDEGCRRKGGNLAARPGFSVVGGLWRRAASGRQSGASRRVSVSVFQAGFVAPLRPAACRGRGVRFAWGPAWC